MRIAPAPGSGRQMTSPSHSLGSTPQRSFKEWIRLNLSPLLLFLGLLVSSIAFLVLIFGALRRGEIHYVWINTPALIYTLTWLSLVTLPVRTIGLRYVVRGFFGGVFLAMALGFPLAKVMKILFGDNAFTVAMWVPFAEEITKTMVLLLLWWGLSRRLGRRPGLSDMTLIGAALGLGLSFHEDMLYPRAFSNFWGDTALGAFGESWGAVFPTSLDHYGIVGLGHLSSGIILGFGVGVFTLLWRRSRLTSLIAGGCLFTLAVVFHGLWNSQTWTAFHEMALRAEPWLNILLIVTAIAGDFIIRSKFAPKVEKPLWRDYLAARRAASGFLDAFERIMCVTHYRHEYQAVANAHFYDSSPTNPAMNVRLTVLRNRALQGPPSVARPTGSANPNVGY